MRLTLHLVTPPPLNDEMIELNSACLSFIEIFVTEKKYAHTFYQNYFSLSRI